MNPNANGLDQIETMQELNESPEALRIYLDWCDGPCTQMVKRILQNRMNGQLGLLNMASEFAPGVVERMYGGQCGGHWILQQMFSMRRHEQQTKDPEPDYGYPELLRRIGRDPAMPVDIEQNQESI
jgi:hypothetical protein